LAGAAAVANCAERMLTVGAGVIAERSRREDGHSGLAATRGHRNATSLVQSIVGGTRTDAARAVRLGETLVEGADAASAVDAGGCAEPAGDGGEAAGSEQGDGAAGWDEFGWDSGGADAGSAADDADGASPDDHDVR